MATNLQQLLSVLPSRMVSMALWVDSETGEYYQGSPRRGEDPSVPERPDSYHAWDFDNSQWVLDPNIRWAEIREERAKRMSAVLWRIDRYNQQIALNVTPSEDITPVLQYVQELRDLPQSGQDPFNITWPVEP